MFSVAIGNYAQIYNKYTDRNIWVNMAGMCAGLRSQTSKNYDAWWASAGLERGQLQNIIKLAFNPSQAQRDSLYKNSDYVFCKVNEANNSEIADYTIRYSVNAFGEAEYVGTTLALKNGSNSSIQKDDLIDA